MTQPTLGRLAPVDPKTIWGHEAHEFTPWLVDNIALLSQALGVEIELAEREVAVGAFSVDIFGKEVGSGREIIIENQLETTDHGHLGQLMTYAAGLDAKIVIWISPRFRDEHSQAIDWLNRRTAEDISFFGVQLEVVRIDNSNPAPLFKVVAQPSEWQKEVSSGAKGARTDRELAYHRFFSDLVDRANSLSPGFSNVKRIGYSNWISFSAGRSYFTVNVAIAKPNLLRVELYMSTGNTEKNRLALAQLREEASEIEAAVARPLAWEQMAKDCRVSLPYDAPVDPANPPHGSVDWAASQAIKFREVFGPRVKRLDLDSLAEGSP